MKKRKIIVAKLAGFCFGVRRAVEMAEETLKKKKGRIFCLGEIIHNPIVVADLEKKGLLFVENIKKVKNGDTLIIRSHGTTPGIIAQAKKKGVKIVDATCPFVGNAQRIIADFFERGFQVVIFGDSKHSEVIGLKANAKNKAIVVESEKDLKKLGKFSKLAFVSQTTQKIDEFKKIAGELSKHAKRMEMVNTICSDSFNKKEEVKKISEIVDVMIVVGGKNSNNTKKLAEISRSLGTKTYHIEKPEEIKKEWLKGAETIGIAAGASTPDKAIKEVIKEMVDSYLYL